MTSNAHIHFIQEGIKAVGIGRKGSKDIPPDLIIGIIQELKKGPLNQIDKGAFMGALWIKGANDAESAILTSLNISREKRAGREAIINLFAYDAPQPIQKLCYKLLGNHTLDDKEALLLGRFLLSQTTGGEGARGLAASILRIRYETREEYNALLKAMNETLLSCFKEPQKINKPIIQIADPLDGCDHTYIITPVIIQKLAESGYHVVCLTGDNSGPKEGNTIFDIIKMLNLPLLRHPYELSAETPSAWYLHQKDVSPAMHDWVYRRRKIVKRPFLSTLERFINPVNADILIASAFHPGYGEKMLHIAQDAGFKKIIIVRNGMEGSTAFALLRNVKIICSKLSITNQYVNYEFEINAKRDIGIDLTKEERWDRPSLEENVTLIQNYFKNQTSGFEHFDHRVKTTSHGLNQALKWLNTIEE